MTIIIETPAPPVRERLVLVPPDAVSRSAGAELLTIRTAAARDATPEDLARAGWAPLAAFVGPLDMLTPPTLEGALEAIRHLADLERHAVGVAEDATREREEAIARAEKAERERDDLLEGDMREARTQRERADQAERERDEARAELARLTAAAEGEPTPGQLLDACPPSGGRLLACYRLGVAHERAWQPAQDRATDEELADLYAREYDAQAHQTRDTFSKSHNDCRRAGILAVAARVRGERCLVARAVGDQLIDSVSIDRVTGGRIRVRVVRRRDPIANPDGESVEAFCKRRSDVPATLARLLGEVSRG